MKKRGRDYSRVADIPFYLKLDKSIDTTRFVTAVRDSIAAHPSYSASFVEHDGLPMLVRSDYPFNLDTKEIAADQFEECAKAFVTTPRSADEPPYRFQLLIAPDKNFFLARINHGISDLTSVVLLLKEICSRYDGEEVVHEKFDLFDYAASKELYQQSEEGKRLLDNFGEMLEGFEKIKPTPIKDVAYYGADLADKKEMNSLRPFIKQMKTSVGKLLMAAYSLALMRLEGKDHVAYVMDYHGRNNPDVNFIHSCIAQKLPVLAKLPASGRVEDFINDFCSTQDRIINDCTYIDRTIMEKYSSYIEYDTSLNIRTTGRTMWIGGTKLDVGQFPSPKFSVPLMAIVDILSDSFFFSLDSNYWDETQLKALHESVRHILFRLPKVEMIDEI